MPSSSLPPSLCTAQLRSRRTPRGASVIVASTVEPSRRPPDSRAGDADHQQVRFGEGGEQLGQSQKVDIFNEKPGEFGIEPRGQTA